MARVGFGVNLRFDLKRSSDAHLAALLGGSWQRYEDAKAKAAPYRLRGSARGFIHHPWAYSWLSVLSYGTWPVGNFCMAIDCSVEGLFSSEAHAVMQMHLALCDIADIEDELQRRIRRKKRSGLIWRR